MRHGLWDMFYGIEQCHHHFHSNRPRFSVHWFLSGYICVVVHISDDLSTSVDLSAAVAPWEINEVSRLLGESWTKLASALLIDTEDIDYYMSHDTTHSARCKKMLTVWAVSMWLYRLGGERRKGRIRRNKLVSEFSVFM